jgi:hypothetical protein
VSEGFQRVHSGQSWRGFCRGHPRRDLHPKQGVLPLTAHCLRECDSNPLSACRAFKRWPAPTYGIILFTQASISLMASSWETLVFHPSSVLALLESTSQSRPIRPTAWRVMGGRRRKNRTALSDTPPKNQARPKGRLRRIFLPNMAASWSRYCFQVTS